MTGISGHVMTVKHAGTDCGCVNGGRCVFETENPMERVKCECDVGYYGVLCDSKCTL